MEDKLTRWARPGIAWLGMIFMALTDVILPTLSQILNLNLPKLTLDPNFWDAWSIAVSLYVGGRSLEKLGINLPSIRKESPNSGSNEVK